MMKSRPGILILAGLLPLWGIVAGCGSPPQHQIRVELVSGERFESVLLTADSSEIVTRRTSPDGIDTLGRYPLGSVRTIWRVGGSSGGAIILGAVGGGIAGVGLAAILVELTRKTTFQGDLGFDGPPTSVIEVGIPVAIAVMTGLGIYLGSTMHNHEKIWSSSHPGDLTKLLPVAIYPKPVIDH